MIFNVKNTIGKKVKVYAHPGVEIKDVTKYNTRTREIEILLFGFTGDGGRRVITKPAKKGYLFPRKVVKVKVKIPYSFIIVNGKRY
jgi:hypothetical protein